MCLSPLMGTSDLDSKLLQRRGRCPKKTFLTKDGKKEKRKKTKHTRLFVRLKIQPVGIKVRQINRLIFKCCPNSQGQCKVQLITPLVAGTSAPWVFDFPARCWTPAAVTRHFVRVVSKRCVPFCGSGYMMSTRRHWH